MLSGTRVVKGAYCDCSSSPQSNLPFPAAIPVWQEREEQTAKLLQQRLTEEAEAKRLAAESARREEERIRREMEARELEEARALLLEAEKRKGRKGKKNLEVGE